VVAGEEQDLVPAAAEDHIKRVKNVSSENAKIERGGIGRGCEDTGDQEMLICWGAEVQRRGYIDGGKPATEARQRGPGAWHGGLAKLLKQVGGEDSSICPSINQEQVGGESTVSPKHVYPDHRPYWPAGEWRPKSVNLHVRSGPLLA